MALDHLENTSHHSAIESVSHIVQDIKDYFMPHNASDLHAQAGKSDNTVGGILPQLDISFDSDGHSQHFDLSGNSSMGGESHQGLEAGQKFEDSHSVEQTIGLPPNVTPYNPLEGVEPAYRNSQVDNNMSSMGGWDAHAFDLDQEKHDFIKMEKAY